MEKDTIKIPQTALVWLCVILGIKLLNIMLLCFSHVIAPLPGVPNTPTSGLGVSFCFLFSSTVFLFIAPRFGLISTAALGAMTAYGAMRSILFGQYILWSAISGVTGIALIMLSIYGWVSLSQSIREKRDKQHD